MSRLKESIEETARRTFEDREKKLQELMYSSKEKLKAKRQQEQYEEKAVEILTCYNIYRVDDFLFFGCNALTVRISEIMSLYWQEACLDLLTNPGIVIRMKLDDTIFYSCYGISESEAKELLPLLLEMIRD